MIPSTEDELLNQARDLCSRMTVADDWLKRDILSHAGNRWAFAVVMALNEHGVLRHAELRRYMHGVTQRMLTRTLRQLERDGLVERHDHREIPPHVEYELLPLGKAFLLKMIPIWAWIFNHADEFREAREGTAH